MLTSGSARSGEAHGQRVRRLRWGGRSRGRLWREGEEGKGGGVADSCGPRVSGARRGAAERAERASGVGLSAEGACWAARGGRGSGPVREGGRGKWAGRVWAVLLGWVDLVLLFSFSLSNSYFKPTKPI